MTGQWLITNNRDIKITGLNLIVNNKEFKLYHNYTDQDDRETYTFKINGEKIFIVIDGFVLPRCEYAGEFIRSTPGVLIKELYMKYHLDFINYIKGNFVLIIIKGNDFHIFNDRIGIRKFFYFIRGSSFILTNRFRLLSGNIPLNIDFEILAIYSLMNQFIDGLTFLKDVFYSKPSSRFDFKGINGTIKSASYWSCEELLNLKTRDISYDSFCGQFVDIIRLYLDYLRPDNISLTLTGGLDSRTILAALLHLEIKPHVFTYGNPRSGDVIIAKQIAELCGLNLTNDYMKPTSEWFAKQADNIIDIGNSIIHIHRAHRLFAVMEKDCHGPADEILFGGYMGGELIRNFFYDGIIITDFTRDWINNKIKGERSIRSHLNRNFLRTDHINLERITGILNAQRFSGRKRRLNEFFLTFLVIAGNYHSQDINLFGYYKRYPLALYLDLDFLQLIFASRYNFMHSKYLPSASLLHMNRHKLYGNLIYRLFPRLVHIPLMKQGYYTPAELVKDNSLVFIGKRLLRKSFSKQDYQVNFSLGNWLKEYTAGQLKTLQNSEIAAGLIDVAGLSEQLGKNNHKSHEKYWRKFTNPVFFGKLFDFYLK